MSGHYYKKNGELVTHVWTKHTVPKKRKLWKSDAMKLGLFPSVTTKLSLLMNESLEVWKKKVMLESAYELHKSPDTHHFKSFAELLKGLSEKVSKEATTYGTYVHKSIEDMIMGHDIIDPGDNWYLDIVSLFIKNNIIKGKDDKLKLEDFQYTETHNYAGRVDLWYKAQDGYGVVDWKTKKTKSLKGRSIPENKKYIMQLGAYTAMVFGEDCFKEPNLKCYICYISSDEHVFDPQLIPNNTLENAYHMFLKTSKLWDYINNYVRNKKAI